MQSQDYTFVCHRVAALSETELADLIQTIRPVYHEFSPKASDGKIGKHIHCHPDAELEIVRNGAGTCTAFGISYAGWSDRLHVLYRDGTVVREEDRSSGVYRELVRRSIERHKPMILCLMTQNPRVYETLQSFAVEGTIYPGVDGYVHHDAQELGMQYCSAPEFSPETLIFRNFYGSVRKEDSFKKVRDERVRKLFELLGPNDGYFVCARVR